MVIIMLLSEVLHASTYDVLDGVYSVAKVQQNFTCPEIFMLSFDSLEATAIYKEGGTPIGVIEQKTGYKLIGINVAVPFYSPGFIAAISGRLAKEGIPVLVVSTYSKDYFIVSRNDLPNALYELKRLGIRENNGE